MAVNIPWMLLSPPSLLSFLSILFPSPVSFSFRPWRTGATSSFASRNSNLPSSYLLSFSIVEHGSKWKHPIDCVPGILACHFSLPELHEEFSTLSKKNAFIYLQNIKNKNLTVQLNVIKFIGLWNIFRCIVFKIDFVQT